MTVELNKYYTKAPNEDWDIYIDISKTVNKTVDPRDVLFSNAPSQVSSDIRSSYTKFIRSSNGYQGFDRTWIDDNNLKFIYYYDTLENALSFYQSLKNSEPQNIFISAIKNSNGVSNNQVSKQYQVKWEISSNTKIVQIANGNIKTGVPI